MICSNRIFRIQPLSQFATRPLQAAVNAGWRKFKNVGQLVVGKAAEVVQHDELARGLVQLLQCVAYFRSQRTVTGGVGGLRRLFEPSKGTATGGHVRRRSAADRPQPLCELAAVL